MFIRHLILLLHLLLLSTGADSQPHFGPDADFEKNPGSYSIEKKEVTRKTQMNIKLARGGGFAISIFEL
jgi:hypothetical protein